MVNKETYEPTLDEIAAGCRIIKAGWSEETRRQRAGGGTIEAVRESMGWRPVVYTEMEVSDILGGAPER